MRCYECGKLDCDKVWITIPTIPDKPCVCKDCLEIRKKNPDFGKYDPRHLRDA